MNGNSKEIAYKSKRVNIIFHRDVTQMLDIAII